MRSYLDEVDFETIKQRFDAFWDREILDRPMIYLTAPKDTPNFWDFPAPQSVEEKWTNIDYVLYKVELGFENTLYMGDAIPYYMPNIGPDSFTAFLGGKLVFMDEGTSWAEPFLEDLSGYEPVLREDNEWWRFMCELIDRICEVAEGNFLVGIPDLHYGGDSLVATIGAQKLVKSLFTEPEVVRRLVEKLADICLTVFNTYYEKISRVQKGSITWIPAYSRGKYFALQDDFSGLVSPKMFREFFLKQQEKISKQLNNSIYHLDGPMALGNLDSLLEIDSLDGIQWVPGAGSKPMSEWLDVCTRIQDAGKCLQIDCEPHEVELLLSKLKHGGLLLCTFCMSRKEAQNVLKIVERYSK
ncbi:MAG: hypothetical protein KIH10_00305 [Candidatus Freyarchaeota archaeon]|nr:hypothetical protein [Candidatus Jordarchaeia archaeon]MBS7280012.1 hypothetical protein [Candidatus Jordarchaeia archaeon]